MADSITPIGVDIELNNIARVVSLYQEYLSTVSSPFFKLYEETIKYPLMEYIERRAFGPVLVETEVNHPVFKSKKIDLKLKVNTITYYFEFKYVRDTYASSIKQSFFNDLVRLHYLSIKRNCRSFFLVAGDLQAFNSALKKEKPNGLNMNPSNSNPSSIPSFKWLLFDEGVKGDCDVRDSSRLYKNFQKAYSEIEELSGGSICFQTLLKSYTGKSSQPVAIWEVF